MKVRTNIMMLLSILPYVILAQIPSKIDFQAIARNNQGDIMQSQNLTVQMSILKGPLPGQRLYQERHAVKTDDYGLFVVAIGTGQQNQGVFSNIDWGQGPHFVHIEIDDKGGNEFTDLGTLELMAVPYAFFARNVENADDADANPTNELQQLSFAGEVLSISNGNSVQLPDSDPENELQQLSLTDGNLLSISRGNTIQLSASGSPWKQRGQSIYLESGRVGVGITTPSNPISIYGQNKASMNFLTSASETGLEDGFSIGLNKLSHSAIVWNYEPGDIRFGTDNQTRMYLSRFGKLGIGTTAPGDLLEVTSENQNAGIRIHAKDQRIAKLSLYETSAGHQQGFSWEYDGKQEKMFLRSKGFPNNSQASLLTIADKGLVGIGTGTQTSFNFHSESYESTLLTLSNANYSNSKLHLGLYQGKPTINFFGQPLQFMSRFSVAMSINPQNGYVGIGPHNPEAELDVQGNVKISEDLDVENNVTISGDTEVNGNVDLMGTLNVGQGSSFTQIREFTGKTSGGLGTYYHDFSYPSGYNQSNTRVLSLEIQSELGNWIGTGGGYVGYVGATSVSRDNSVRKINAVLYGNHIRIHYPAREAYQNQSFRILLLRLEE